MKNSFSENIRKFRRENGWSQENFATEVAKSLASDKEKSFSKSVSQWENGVYPPMETCIAIAELMDITLDDLFSREINEFKENYVKPDFEEKGKFKIMPNENLEILTSILKNLGIEKRKQDEEEFELFSSFISLGDKEESKKVNLSLIIGKQPFSQEFAQTCEIKLWGEIEKWLETKVFKYYFQQKIFGGVSVSYVSYNNGTKGYVAEIFFNLSKDDIKELFIEHAKREVTVIIEKAEEDMIDYTGDMLKNGKGELI